VSARPVIAILGASGLIGEAVAAALLHEGWPVVPIARHFTSAQKAAFGPAAIESPVVALGAEDLARLLPERQVEIIVNCIGVLQDGPRGTTDAVHRAFVERLVGAVRAWPILLIHVSIPGTAEDDRTDFSRTKRAAEQTIVTGGIPFVILRPGFVVATAAYGGSALMRALAMLPVALPVREAASAFAVTSIDDIARTIEVVAGRWRDGERDWNSAWDVMARGAATVGGVVDAFRHRLGGPAPWVRLPGWLMGLGARAGDLAALLGWSPPIRSTSLAEMRRGVEGDPGPWIAATGIEPASLAEMMARLPATVQEKWFARLYLLKALIIAGLVSFWVVSGLIAVTVAFDSAAAMLTAHGLAPGPADAVTIVSSLADISVGLLIAIRRSCRLGLMMGIVLSLGYMGGAAVLTPELWIEPLGALVKTGPAIVLMLVALALLEDR